MRERLPQLLTGRTQLRQSSLGMQGGKACHTYRIGKYPFTPIHTVCLTSASSLLRASTVSISLRTSCSFWYTLYSFSVEAFESLSLRSLREV